MEPNNSTNTATTALDDWGNWNTFTFRSIEATTAAMRIQQIVEGRIVGICNIAVLDGYLSL